MLTANPFIEKSDTGIRFSGNRYTYVLNNPLKYTDPTGYIYDWKRIQAEKEAGDMFKSSGGGGPSAADRSLSVWDLFMELSQKDPNTDYNDAWMVYWDANTDPDNNGKLIVSSTEYTDWYKKEIDPKTGIEKKTFMYSTSRTTYYEYELSAEEYKNITNAINDGSTAVGLSGQLVDEIVEQVISKQKKAMFNSGKYKVFEINSGKLLYSNYNPLLDQVSSVAKNIDIYGSLGSTIIDYAIILDGSAEPINLLDAFVGTAEVFSITQKYITGQAIPGVGQAAALYALCRLSWNFGESVRRYYDAKKEEKNNKPRVLDINWNE